ncbi:MAG: AAA family ATPase [Planctomycetes bacterium]|nr:AAA family ATPase [Planctomycetota bacterium]
MTFPGALSREENQFIEGCGRAFEEARSEISRRIVGQDRVIEELLTALLAEGHCLIIGVPGLAKTLLVSTLAELLSLTFRRIQFTPDLMPTDITGATVIALDRQARERSLNFLKGPIFTNILLADEINRTPPKTQAALMEAMEERQVTAGGVRHPLSRPFFVLATQNPIEQEGTYPLPVSQLDRFLFNVLIDYPEADEEFKILEFTTSAYEASVRCLIERDWLLRALDLVRKVEVEDHLVEYASRLVRWSRPANPQSPSFIKEWVSWGGGPRAVQSMLLGAKARAVLYGRSAVQVEDLHRAVFPALRHRLLLSYHGKAEGIEPDTIIEQLLLAMPEQLYQPKPAATAKPPSRWKRLSRFFGRR